MGSVHSINELRDRVDALELWNVWDCGIYQKELETKCAVGEGAGGGGCAELWTVTALAERKDRYFPSVRAKISREMLLEWLLEPKQRIYFH